jgi:hypothetical protein
MTTSSTAVRFSDRFFCRVVTCHGRRAYMKAPLFRSLHAEGVSVMKRIRFLFGLGTAFSFTACAGLFGGSSGQEPLPVPAPPVWPEPTLVVRGPVLAYAVNGEAVDGFTGPDTVAQELAIGKVVIRLRTPKGWTAHDAGAVWLENAEFSASRFVVYHAANYEEAFRSDWRDRDVHDATVTVSPIHTLDSPRKPYLYTYRRSDDGRCGIVYALLTDPNRADSGIIVHGVWLAEYDRRLRPIVVAAANGVTVSGR